MAIEEPRYRLVDRSGDIDIREYAPRVVAEVEVEADFEEAGSKGFRPLADYIFGNNKPETKVEMTAPVSQEPAEGAKIAMTAPVTQQEDSGRHVVRFTMPASYTLETLPAPRNPRVKLRQLESSTVAVIRYSGFWSQKNYEEQLVALRSKIKARGMVEQGPPTWARYNAPITPWFMRRNEIHIPVSSAD